MKRFFFVALLMGALSGCTSDRAATPQNVIMFITDGCGPASFTMARDFVREFESRDALHVDPLLVGSVRTFASDNRITDSAASATAYACGVKTYNGAIAMDTDRQPVATLLEAAEAMGMQTGLVATSTITHATPASYSAHVESRGMQAEIASQQIEQGIEVMLGGGIEFFLPTDADGSREDGRNLIEEAESLGYSVVRNQGEMATASETPVLGLFSEGQMAYELDRPATEQPSIAEMTQKALDLIGDAPQGFFLMVEASRIDHAGHANDAAGHVREILAFEEAFALALEFAKEDGETLIVSTSDHETGGLTLGRRLPDGAYGEWDPAPLEKATATYEGMGRKLGAGADWQAIVAEGTGITDFSPDELASIEKSYEARDGEGFMQALTEAVGRRAVVGWTSGGHTAVDVPLFAYGPGSERFKGNKDNTAIGLILADLMGADLPALTQALREKQSNSDS